MQKTLKIFFVFSLLLIFLSNVSGIRVCLDHAKHFTEKAHAKKHDKDDKTPVFSQDDECQCALHLQMSNSLLPEIQNLDLAFNTATNSEMPQPKAKTYRCLLDYFSSRAPPSLS